MDIENGKVSSHNASIVLEGGKQTNARLDLLTALPSPPGPQSFSTSSVVRNSNIRANVFLFLFQLRRTFLKYN